MIHRLIDFSLRYRGFVLAFYLALGLWGFWALRTASLDAIPDLSDQQVIVFTDWSGHSPQEVEDQITYPLTVNLQGLAGVRVVRSQSAFGFSMVYVVFHDDVDLYFARSRVLERLGLASTFLPDGVAPTLGPDATGVGHVFWYTVESDTMSLRDLRSLQDWFIRYQLNAVAGVAEVASIGGTVKQYQIDVDPNRLRSYGISLAQVVEAVTGSNSNVGGNVIESNGTWTVVRGLGLVERPADLESVVIRASGGVPVAVRDVARVQIGDSFRVASLVKGDREVVGGVVVARAGANAQAVIDGVKAKLAEIAPGLPAGVRVVPFYDRSGLIGRVVDTLKSTLIEEMLLVTVAHIVFLMHFRSILIVTLPLPLAVLVSFLGMKYLGVTSNLMSLAGIAIAIGVLVDAGIVVTENAFRQLELRRVDMRDRRAVLETVRASLHLVGRPMFFSMAAILLAFTPVFALTGQEGKLFHPLAFTKTFAVLGAMVMALTLVPVLCTFLLAGTLHSEESSPIMRGLRRLYEPLLRAALNHRVATLLVALGLLAGSLGLAQRIGSEFMPPLDEGDLLFMPVADPSVSLAQNTAIAKQQNAALLAFPEVDTVVAKVARAETSTDPAPLNMTETLVHLKPKAEWRPGMTLDRLRAEMGQAAQVPGVTNIWTMPIINRIDMLTTGIRSELGVKIFGTDLKVLDEVARQVGAALREVPGAANVYPEPLTGAQYLNLRVDRDALGRYGLGVGAVQDAIAYGIGETSVGTTIEGRERYPIRVRLAPEFRGDAAAIGNTLVTAPGGEQVPLRAVTTIEPASGPAMILSENGLLVATVLLNVQGRDVGSFVEEARAVVAQRVSLPAGYYLGWSGRYENQAHARDRLMVVIPIVLVVIFLMLYATYRSAIEAAHVLLAVPFALTGGIYLQWMLGYHFSVAVWVGFIALFGTAVQTAVVMVIYLEEAVERRRVADGGLTRASLREAVIAGALLRLRPKVMTVSTVVAALLPIMWTSRPGAEVLKPLATPVLGGMISSLLHVLLVTPVIFFWLRERDLRAGRLGAHAPADVVGTPDVAPVAWPDRPAAQPTTTAPVSDDRDPTHTRSSAGRWIGAGAGVLVVLAVVGWWFRGPASEPASTTAVVVAEARAGEVAVRLLAPTGRLTHGRTRALLEFQADGKMVAVDDVRLEGVMSMPGMTMTATSEIARPDGSGRYPVEVEFAMAGNWRLTVAWTRGGAPGRVTFDGAVQ